MGRGRNKKGRNVHGILILDKPPGITSNQALQRVKFLYQARKAGHTGSLDKMATGLLPLCFGEGTKFSGYLLNSDKQYDAIVRLGRETTTGDEEGEIVTESAVPNFTAGQLEDVLEQFRGEIEQVPPMYSALKHKGQRLYKLAYQGIEVERKPRPVNIYKLEIRKIEDGFLYIHVNCSKGTYIRTLAQDIGRVLECGACIHKLRRIAAGPFTETQMLTFDELGAIAEQGEEALDDKLLSIDTAVTQMPEVNVNREMAAFLNEGQPVIVANAPTAGLLRIYSEKAFLGLGEVLDDGRIAPRRLVRL